MKFKVFFKRVSGGFHGSFKGVSMMFKNILRGSQRSFKIFKGASRLYFVSSFIVAWRSWQLTNQKEGLF